MSVNSGDLVIADADGVVVIARERIAALLPEASKKVAEESARIEAIKKGDTSAKWLLGALRKAGPARGRVPLSHNPLSHAPAPWWRGTPPDGTRATLGHAAAALYHHYFVRDNTLQRMVPGRG